MMAKCNSKHGQGRDASESSQQTHVGRKRHHHGLGAITSLFSKIGRVITAAERSRERNDVSPPLHSECFWDFEGLGKWRVHVIYM